MKFVKNRYAVLLGFGAVLLILSFLVRTVLLVWAFPQSGLRLSHLPAIYGKGLIYDAGVALFFTIAYALYLLLLPRNPSSGHSQSTAIVHTAPLAADQIVRTTAMNSPATMTQSRVLLVTTAVTKIEILRSSNQSLEMVSDQQLLALFEGQPVALVTIGPGERRLVLPDAE